MSEQKAYLYKITNVKNGMCYYGITWGKSGKSKHHVKTPEERFEEHMTGNGGKLLYEYGVQKYGRESFVLEVLEHAELSYIRDKEVELNKDNLYPKGYNGCTTHAIVLSESGKRKRKEKIRKSIESGEREKPIPPNWKGKKRSSAMRKKLSESKMGHEVSEETREKIRKKLKGRKHSKKTNQKRVESINKSENAFGRKKWLFISPDGLYYYVHGNKDSALEKFGLTAGPGFYGHLNKGTSPKQGKAIGWKFYCGEEIIKEQLKNIDEKLIEEL